MNAGGVALSVFKPRGMARYGRRRREQDLLPR